jgi:hypothetical protein
VRAALLAAALVVALGSAAQADPNPVSPCIGGSPGAPSTTGGNLLSCDSNRYLNVHIQAGGGGAVTFPYNGTADGQTPTAGSAVAIVLFNGTTYDRAQSGANNADGVTALTLGVAQTNAYDYGWNASTSKWDRIRLDTSDNIDVNVQVLPALAAGSATIGNVNQTAGKAGYSFLLDSAGTNVAGVDANHNAFSILRNGSGQLIGPSTAANSLPAVLSVSQYLYATSANVVTATTTLLVTHSASTTTYIMSAYEQSGGTQSTSTALYEYGTGTNCGTGTTTLTKNSMNWAPPVGQFAGFGSSSTATTAANDPPAPSQVPFFVVPSGNDFCVVSAGTTINAYFYTIYLQQ